MGFSIFPRTAPFGNLSGISSCFRNDDTVAFKIYRHAIATIGTPVALPQTSSQQNPRKTDPAFLSWATCINPGVHFLHQFDRSIEKWENTQKPASRLLERIIHFRHRFHSEKPNRFKAHFPFFEFLCDKMKYRKRIISRVQRHLTTVRDIEIASIDVTGK